MTALEGLERLEAPALWHPGGDAPPREVYLAFGEATLLIQSAGGEPLAHWSLPAIRRDGDGVPARYRPGRGAAEAVELSEPDMIAALERVRLAVERARPRRRRMARIAAVVVLVALVAAGVAWLPDALRAHVAQTLPPSARAEIGSQLLARVTTLTGPPCDAPAGRAALERLRAAVRPAPARALVLRDLQASWIALPGGVALLAERTVAGPDGAERTAGALEAAGAAAAAGVPIERLVADLPAPALLRLYATARVDDARLARHAGRLLLDPGTPAPGGREATLDPAARSALAAVCAGP